jgi:hypothetical protein
MGVPGVVALMMLSTYLLIAGLVVSPVVFIISFACTGWKRARSAALALTMGSLIFLCSGVLALAVERRLEDAGVDRAIQRGQPLVDAIERFQAANGRSPESLQELVPSYIASVPGTGASAFPEFTYLPTTGQAGAWSLSVHIGKILFDWRHVEYRPNRAPDELGSPRGHGWFVVDP